MSDPSRNALGDDADPSAAAPSTDAGAEPLDPTEQPVAGGRSGGEPAQGTGRPDSY